MKVHFLQKTGSKLVKFGLCDPIFILHPAIGGRHPVPCLSTQITERQGTAMYYPEGCRPIPVLLLEEGTYNVQLIELVTGMG